MTDATSPIQRAHTNGERGFRELADFAPVMIWRAGPDKQCDWFNRPWLAFTGRHLDQEVGDGWAQGVHPDDLDRCMSTYLDAFDAREPFSMEYRLRRHDGQYVWLLDNGAPFERDGAFAGYWGSCVDVSAHREAQQAQRILINDLSHRVKNTLSVVQAMAYQSFRGDRPVSDSLCAFECRLGALAATHDLLLTGSAEDIPLPGLIETVMAPHDPGGRRVAIQGPALMLAPDTVLPVAMAIHELFTNASKYGALSTGAGTVAIDWTFDDAVAPARFHLRWKERGGPAVTVPTRRGFGTRFIEGVLARQFGGTASVAFEGDGVCCRFDAPAKAVRATRAIRLVQAG